MELKEYATVIAIGILFALFFGLLADAFYTAPKYEDFCKTRYAPSMYPEKIVPVMDPATCAYTTEHKVGVQSCYDQKGQPTFDYDAKGCEIYKDCDFCNTLFQDANSKYNRNIFLMLAPLGGLAVILGLIWSSTIVAGGVMFGGILLLIYSTFRYFSDMSKIMRVVVIFIELVLLIILALRKLERKKKR